MLRGRGYIAYSLIKTIIDVAEEGGANRASLLGLIGLEETALNDVTSRLSLERVIELFQLAIAQTGAPDLGLQVGQRIRPGSLNALGYALMSSDNLSEAFTLHKSFGGTIADCAELSLNIEGNKACVSFTVQHEKADLVRPINDMFMSTFWLYAQWITRVVDAELLGVSFTHPEPQHTQKYLDVFHVAPDFASGRCTLSFDTKYLGASLHQADQGMNSLMKSKAESVKLNIKASANLYASVAHQIRLLMPKQRATLTIVAKQLNMSERSLSRRLKEEGYSFKSVLLNVRESLALENLRDLSLSVTDIAKKLGYRDYSSFSHAFRGWTGYSPSEYREKMEKGRDSEEK